VLTTRSGFWSEITLRSKLLKTQMKFFGWEAGIRPAAFPWPSILRHSRQLHPLLTLGAKAVLPLFSTSCQDLLILPTQ
jgi:hypothetical protein